MKGHWKIDPEIEVEQERGRKKALTVFVPLEKLQIFSLLASFEEGMRGERALVEPVLKMVFGVVQRDDRHPVEGCTPIAQGRKIAGSSQAAGVEIGDNNVLPLKSPLHQSIGQGENETGGRAQSHAGIGVDFENNPSRRSWADGLVGRFPF